MFIFTVPDAISKNRNVRTMDKKNSQLDLHDSTEDSDESLSDDLGLLQEYVSKKTKAKSNQGDKAETAGILNKCIYSL